MECIGYAQAWLGRASGSETFKGFLPHAPSSNALASRDTGHAVQVRDSKDPDGPVLTFRLGEFGALLAGAKDGEFGQPEF